MVRWRPGFCLHRQIRQNSDVVLVAPQQELIESTCYTPRGHE